MNSLPGAVRLGLGQTRYQLRVFFRTPVAAFFTLVFPIMFLVLFNALFNDGSIDTGQGEVTVGQFYTGSLGAFAAVSATYTNLANTVPILRDTGVLKRWRGTPMPPASYVAGMIGMAVVVATIGVLAMLTLGVAFYDLQIEGAKLPAAGLTFVVGVGSFAAMGMACAALIPNATSAPAVANATILPLSFVSNIFIPLEDPPRWLDRVGDIFPLKSFVVAFQDTFNPFVEAPALDWGKLGWITLWGVAAGVVAVRRFRWEPSAEGRSGRRSRRSASTP